jgi:MinD-like ATPase involved in chromosome partitioning or flagellar assembly
VLGVPGADAAAVARLEGEGLTVLSVAQTALALKRDVATLHPSVVLLQVHLPNANAALIDGFARSGVATILLVDRALRRDDDLLAGTSPYPPSVLAQQERLGCVLVGAWPPVPGELRLLAEQAAEVGPVLAHTAAPGLPRAATGGTIALSGNAGGAGKSQLAANLATLLGVLCERRVALMDMDLINASLHDTLGLVVPPGTGLDALHAAAVPPVREAVRRATAGRRGPATGQDDPVARAAAQEAVAALDPTPYLVRYPQATALGAGIDVLTGVTSMAAADRVAGDLDVLYALVHLLRSRYDDVVIDLGTDTTTIVHEGLAARADLLLVVTWPTPDAIERVARHHAHLVRATGLDPARCRLVINHVPADATAMVPALEILARLSEAGPISVGGLIAQDIDLVGRARLADPEQPLLPVLLSDRAARRSRFVRGVEDLVEHVRPGVLPRRETLLDRLARQLGGAWSARSGRPPLADASPT